MNDQGEYYTTSQGDLQSKCILCNSQNSLLYQDKCISCKPLSFLQSVNNIDLTKTACSEALLTSGGVLFYEKPVSDEKIPNVFSVKFGVNSFVSWWSNTYLVANYRLCAPACDKSSACVRNATACQVLANTCVMNLYNQISFPNAGVDACSAFKEIVKTSANTAWDVKMPWLNYEETLGIYKTVYLSDQSKSINLKFADKCDSSSMSFYTARYSLNGKLLEFGPIEVS